MAAPTAHADDDKLGPLLLAQFTGAFNDNAWKMIVTLLLLGGLVAEGSGGAEAQALTTRAFLVFTLPLVLFSLPAAYLADRIAKDRIIRWMKALEILLMGGAALALLVEPGGGWPALLVLALMGAQSAVFSPAKYGIIPELVRRERIVAANGALELATFVAIILGTGLGGILLELGHGRPALAPIGLALLAGLGWAAARRIPRLEAAGRNDEGFAAALRGGWCALRRDRALRLATFGSALAWFLLALLGQDILVWTKNDLGLGDGLASLPPALFGLGLGLGGVLAGRVAGRGGAMGLVPLGALLAAGLLALFAALGPGLSVTMALSAALGLATGLVVVPVDGMIQRRAPRRRRGAVIAIGNLFIFGAMLGGSLLAAVLAGLGLGTLAILGVAAVVAMLGGLWGLLALPGETARLLLRAFLRVAHDARFRGLGRLPERGGALLCPNHVSFLDWAYLAVMTERRLRFVVAKEWYERWPWRWFLARAGAIPISGGEGPRVLLEGLRRAGAALDRGELVVLFPEGEISRTGDLLPFRRGFLRLVEGRSVPVVPIAISGLEESRFAPGARGLGRPRPVILRVGAPLIAPGPAELRAAVLGLLARNEIERAASLPPLHHLVLRQALRRPLGTAWVSEEGRRTSWLRAAIAGSVLARRLDERSPGEERIAVLLPPSSAAALANLAISLAGKTSVNLNFSAGPAALGSAWRQAGRPLVVTSGRFLDRLGIELPAEARLAPLEEILGDLGLGAKLRGLLDLMPARRPRVTADELATVIFSSGSTGEPKGVQLAHRAVAWNVRAALRRARLGADDVLLGCLPTCHSFGFFALWLAAAAGMRTAFQANPLDAAALGRRVWRERATVLMATPSFLSLYLKRCEPGDLASLELVVAGAERLSPGLAAAFERRFGIRPIEGYGATECAPVIAMSGPDHRGRGVYQPGSRPGSVGRPLPGLALQIVDPDTLIEREDGEEGLVVVRGPNLMRGYLGREDLDREVFRGGFYLTGDIGRLDEDGFLVITDRLSRYAKIGGEMVPCGRVEEALQQALGRDERAFAVTAIPDATKGESLAVLHLIDEALIPDLLESLRRSGLPNLFIPRPDRFLRVAELPLLASGKLDLARLRRLALATLEPATDAA